MEGRKTTNSDSFMTKNYENLIIWPTIISSSFRIIDKAIAEVVYQAIGERNFPKEGRK